MTDDMESYESLTERVKQYENAFQLHIATWATVRVEIVVLLFLSLLMLVVMWPVSTWTYIIVGVQFLLALHAVFNIGSLFSLGDAIDLADDEESAL